MSQYVISLPVLYLNTHTAIAVSFQETQEQTKLSVSTHLYIYVYIKKTTLPSPKGWTYRLVSGQTAGAMHRVAEQQHAQHPE